jgi:hypothetical protein
VFCEAVHDINAFPPDSKMVTAKGVNSKLETACKIMCSPTTDTFMDGRLRGLGYTGDCRPKSYKVLKTRILQLLSEAKMRKKENLESAVLSSGGSEHLGPVLDPILNWEDSIQQYANLSSRVTFERV